MRRRLLFLVGTMLAQNAFAQQPYEVEVRSRVLVGQEKPALIIKANEDLEGLGITLKGPKGVKRQRISRIGAGESVEISFDAPIGVTQWVAEISHQRNTEAITFEVVVARPIAIEIQQGDVDLEKGLISFSCSEPIALIRIETYGEDGRLLFREEQAVQAQAKERVQARFQPSRERIGRLVLTVFDRYGFYNGIEATPFLIEIPHEEVLFDFGSADIRSSEEPKLHRSLEAIRAAISRLASAFKARLYVAGYTDTVGTREYNLALSQKRAEAIARWFKKQGLGVQICWQGFGEDALAISTPDETPEPRNRRTVYVLADQPPPVSASFPRADWHCLGL